MGMDVELAQRVANRALSLARAEASVDGAADVLRTFARGDREVLALARSRCLAAADQDPGDAAARRAVGLIDASLVRPHDADLVGPGVTGGGTIHPACRARNGGAMVSILRSSSFGGGGGEPLRCSFCGRRDAAVDHLVRARGVFICDRCVAQANEAIGSAPTDQKLLRIRPAPARVAGRDAAEAAFEEAFHTVFSAERSTAERCQAIELGDNLGPTLEEARQRQPATRIVDVSVDSTRFLTEDEAEVQFTLWVSQFGSSGMRQTGHAMRVGDDWKVSRSTWCGLVRMIGVECPPPPD